MWCVPTFLLFESILHFFFLLCWKEKLCGGIVHCSLFGYHHFVVLIWGKSKGRKKEMACVCVCVLFLTASNGIEMRR